jgi:hypothetical protein
MKPTPTRTLRDDRGVTRLLDVTPARAVRWWFDPRQQLWIVDVVDREESSLSYGAAYAQRDYLYAVVQSAARAIEEDPEGDSYKHY